MEWCRRSLVYLYTAFKLQGNMLSEPRNWGLMSKAVFLHCETWIVGFSNLPEKHFGHFSLHNGKNFGQVFEFYERNNLLANSSSEVI